MKKLFLIVSIALLTMGFGYAQHGGGDPAEKAQKEIDALTKELSLSKDQVVKVTPIINEEYQKQADAYAKMRESGTMDRDKMHEERNKLTAETDAQLKAVLTADQGVKLDAYRKTQAEERAKMYQQQK